MSKLVRLVSLVASLVLSACASSASVSRGAGAAPLRRVDLAAYDIGDLRAARTPEGPGYAFVVERARDARPEWAVRLGGQVTERDLRVAVTEHAELVPAHGALSRFTLHVASSDHSHLAGTLESAAKTYRIDGVPRGALPLGHHEFGLSALQIIDGERVVAIVDVSGERLEASLAEDVDPNLEGLFVSVALVVGLTSRALDQAGARFMWRRDVGLSDFTCITSVCDSMVNRLGHVVGAEASLMESVHRGQISY